MELLRICSILSLAVAFSQAYSRAGYKPDKKEDATPMVAFMCGKPAMHFTPQGWVKDEKTDCLKTPNDILNYCKQMYPDMEITNFVEADHKETIDNWCGYGARRCHHHGSHTVRPFKCLVGPFQSDALLVPDHCVFDHIHQSEECKSFHEWNKTAGDACKSKHKMNKQSFAILLPCAVNMFGGVEYVCCPSDDKTATKVEDQNKMEVDDKMSKMIYPTKINSKPAIAGDKAEQKLMAEKFAKVQHYNKDWRDDDWSSESSSSSSSSEEEEEEDDYWDEDEDDYNYEEDENEWEDSWEDEEDKLAAPPTTTTTTKEPSTTEKSVSQPTDAYNEYLRGGNRYLNEHEYFVRAKSELQKHHHEKVTKMMKEWAAARQRVQEMKNTDAKAADKLNREITARFQKTYEALEQEGMAEKKQLIALHQQRVQASLNEKKRHAMEHYMGALQKTTPEATSILKSLKHYIKMEQKDRMHTINHFKHLRDTDPIEAERVRQQTRDHLAIIDQRMQQSVEMLNRVPDYAKKIKVQIDNFLASFHEIDVSINSLLEAHPAKVTVTTSQERPVEPPTADIEVKVEHEQPTPEKEDIPSEKPSQTVPETEKPTEEKVPVAKPAPEKEDDLHRIPLANSAPLKPTKYDAAEFDDEVMEDEHAYIDIKPAPPAHQGVNELSMKESTYVEKKRLSTINSVQTGSTLGIAVGCIAVFVIIVVGIVVLRKKAGRVPVSHGFVEVDQAASPEERHVANMQINGYENPTYKYFEMNGNA